MPAVLEQSATHLTCAHCGDTCPTEPLLLAERPFCCAGCRTVYELLDANNLCTYYRLGEQPGLKVQDVVRAVQRLCASAAAARCSFEREARAEMIYAVSSMRLLGAVFVS